MRINKEKVIALMNEYAKGNYNEFARMLNLNVAHVYRTLVHENTKAGPKFLGALISFCETRDLDYKDYIFLN